MEWPVVTKELPGGVLLTLVIVFPLAENSFGWLCRGRVGYQNFNHSKRCSNWILVCDLVLLVYDSMIQAIKRRTSDTGTHQCRDWNILINRWFYFLNLWQVRDHHTRTTLSLFLSSWTWTVLQLSCIFRLRGNPRGLIRLTCKELASLQSSWPSGLQTAQMSRYFILIIFIYTHLRDICI